MKYSAALFAIAVATASAVVPSLTPENYDIMTSGKTVFIRFFAPWGGHCKALAPHWEKLSRDFEGDAVIFVAEIDCTSDGNKPLCDANDIRNMFPTIKYGDPNSLETYKGGRYYDALSKFAKDNLKPICSPSNPHICDDEKMAHMANLMAMSDDELAAAISAEEEKLDESEEIFDKEVEKLKEKEKKLLEMKEAAKAAIRASLRLMKHVKAT